MHFLHVCLALFHRSVRHSLDRHHRFTLNVFRLVYASKTSVKSPNQHHHTPPSKKTTQSQRVSIHAKATRTRFFTKLQKNSALRLSKQYTQVAISSPTHSTPRLASKSGQGMRENNVPLAVTHELREQSHWIAVTDRARLSRQIFGRNFIGERRLSTGSR